MNFEDIGNIFLFYISQHFDKPLKMSVWRAYPKEVYLQQNITLIIHTKIQEFKHKDFSVWKPSVQRFVILMSYSTHPKIMWSFRAYSTSRLYPTLFRSESLQSIYYFLLKDFLKYTFLHATPL